ncbi:hypothetical protein TIFTF001_037694 [Ficus carica]|uniref:Transposase Tnp1/En/Spm-like domain-containing protein n=1 Tax=Ficus carica TaxID=3494 RepID=A0AA88EA94_FICCA|nr:hypothetical protein TIFTF001_037694 [Ficus carica]
MDKNKTQGGNLQLYPEEKQHYVGQDITREVMIGMLRYDVLCYEVSNLMAVLNAILWRIGAADCEIMNVKVYVCMASKLPRVVPIRARSGLVHDLGTQVVISRVDAWSRAHKKKNGEPVNALAAEVIEKLEEVEHATPFPSTNVKEDALSRVFGPEKHGQLRGLGKGVSLSKLSFMLERDDHLNSLEEKYGKVLEQLIHMNGLVELLMKNQSSSDKSGSEANAHAPVPMKVNIESSEDKNCEILDWFGSGEVVAKGHWSSSDPKDLVHHVPLGPNAIKVWIHVPIKPDAFLWRPNSEMACIEDAVGSIVAWPVDKVVLKRNVLEGLLC